MKKRGAILWFCMICAMAVCGQNTSVLQRFGVKTDAAHQRAEINLDGAFPAFALAPNGNCWLVSSHGLPYFTPDIWWSDWHCASPICPEDNNVWSDHKLFFFSTDTALLCPGYAFFSDSSYYYLTTDGGNTWIKKNFGIEVYMKDGCMDEEKRLWLANRKSSLLYSEDHGKTFKVLQLPINDTNNFVCSIDMHGGRYGLAGLDNLSQIQLLYTDDNWTSARFVPLPSEANPREQIDKVLIWNDFWVIKQEQKVFYTPADEVAWQHFPIPVVDFFPDRETGCLMAVTDSLQVVVFSSPTDYRLLCEETLPKLPAEGAVQNGCLYVWCRYRYLCKVDSTEVTPKSQFYTSELNNRPTEVYEGEEIRWGTEWKNGGTYLYAADKQGSEWYQHLRLPLCSHDFQLISDSVASYWDGTRHFTLNLINGEAKPTTLENPLQDFLTAPITEVLISSSSANYREDILRLTAINDSTLRVDRALQTYCQRTHVRKHIPKRWYKGKYHFRPQRARQKCLHYRHDADSRTLTSILADINQRSEQMPSITEFNITAADKKRFTEMVNHSSFYEKFYYSEDPAEWHKDFAQIKSFYLSVPEHIDTIGEATLQTILSEVRAGVLEEDYYVVRITNKNGDTLCFFDSYYPFQSPWSLPWIVGYDNLHFTCYLPVLSQWIAEVVPENFYGKARFDNALLLMRVANYLWREQLKQVSQ